MSKLFQSKILFRYILPNDHISLSLASPQKYVILPGQYVMLTKDDHSYFHYPILNKDGISLDFLMSPHDTKFQSLTQNDPIALSSPLGEHLEYENLPNRKILLLSKDKGISPLIFFAQSIKHLKPISLIHFSDIIPFTLKPSHLILHHMKQLTAGIPLLEDWGLASRISTTKEIPGCLQGDLVTLFKSWNMARNRNESWDIYLFACKETMQSITEIMHISDRLTSRVVA